MDHQDDTGVRKDASTLPDAGVMECGTSFKPYTLGINRLSQKECDTSTQAEGMYVQMPLPRSPSTFGDHHVRIGDTHIGLIVNFEMLLLSVIPSTRF